MERTKKETVPICARINADTAKNLKEFCAETGITQTAAIEKAVTMYMKEYLRKNGSR